MKSKRFVREKISGKTVEAVGGINGVLGRRLNEAGVGSAIKLSCKMRGMTKRKYLRYMMKVLSSTLLLEPMVLLRLTRKCFK